MCVAAATLVVAIGVTGASAPRSSRTPAPVPPTLAVAAAPTPRDITPSTPRPEPFVAGQLLRATDNIVMGDRAIHEGQSLYVIGRESAADADVYTIQHGGDLRHGIRPDTTIEQVDAEVLHEQAVPYRAACPGTVSVVEDIAALQPFERLVCFGARELTFSPAQRHAYHVLPDDPPWLAGESGVDFFTAIPYRAASGVHVPVDGWLRVTGHFDDRSCAGDLRCRERFVVTTVTGVERPKSELGGTWKRMAKAPIGGRSSYVALGTDRGTFIWGGDPIETGATAAIYNAARDLWTRTATAPDEGRIAVASAWSGKEVLVWGGLRGLATLGDGLAYDPAVDRWRVIPAAPIRPGFGVGAWTGNEFVVVSSEAETAAWDPAAGRWHRLPDPPLPPGAMESVWTGKELLVLGIGDGTAAPVIGAALDPQTRRWRRIADVPYDGQILGIPARWIGTEMVFVAHAYDPVTNRWRALTGANCSPKAVSYGVWTGRWLMSQVAAYDPALDRCLSLPRSPNRPASDGSFHEFHTPFWVDGRLVVWSGGTGLDGPAPPDGIVFTPSDP